jgi:hypothetical protein
MTVSLDQHLINQTHSNENVWESGGIALPFLISALDGGVWSASSLDSPSRKSPQYISYGRLGGPQSPSQCCVAD